MADVSLIGPPQYGEVISFYQHVGYGGTIAPDDLIVGARIAGRLVAAVRLATENDLLVLRGMYVLREHQRQGIGSSLLPEIERRIGQRECWCLPYAHLRKFYARAGFQDQPSAEAPKFLVERKNVYTESGKQVVLMKRLRTPPVVDTPGPFPE
jgi:GNAT superfamily N-acetyltransferase